MAQFTAMLQLYGDKIKGLKELYAFCLVLKAKVVAYKKTMCHEPVANALDR